MYVYIYIYIYIYIGGFNANAFTESGTQHIPFHVTSLVIRQKSESLNGSCKKIKHSKFSEKRTFTLDTHTYMCVSGVRNVRFSEN